MMSQKAKIVFTLIRYASLFGDHVTPVLEGVYVGWYLFTIPHYVSSLVCAALSHPHPSSGPSTQLYFHPVPFCQHGLFSQTPKGPHIKFTQELSMG